MFARRDEGYAQNIIPPTSLPLYVCSAAECRMGITELGSLRGELREVVDERLDEDAALALLELLLEVLREVLERLPVELQERGAVLAGG